MILAAVPVTCSTHIEMLAAIAVSPAPMVNPTKKTVGITSDTPAVSKTPVLLNTNKQRQFLRA
jgi:hypothetical protein